MSSCDLHTGHVGAAGVQSCEAVVAAAGGVHAERVIRAQFSVVESHRVAVAGSRAALHPGHQQHGGSPGLQSDRETRRVAWDRWKESGVKNVYAWMNMLLIFLA